MRFLAFTVLLAGACTPVVTTLDGENGHGGGGHDGGNPADDADSGASDDSGGTSSSDTGDDDVESVPGVPDALPRVQPLCHIVVDCDRDIPDEPKIDCHLTVTNHDGRVDWDGTAGLELRGRSSMDAPKHQFGVELRDEAGEETQGDLLGMGRASDWVFNGAYFDRLLVRNILAFDIFNAMDDDRYAPQVVLCDMELDGEWQGVYHLSERIDADGARLDLPDDDGTAATFVMKNDDSGEGVDNTLGTGLWASVYPANPTPEQRAGMAEAYAAWVDATRNPTDAGMSEVLDLDTAVDLILLEELMKNVDAYYLSLRLWRVDGGPMHFSPWDLDLTLGGPSYNDNENPRSWVAYRPDMVASLGDIPGFDTRLSARWTELRQGILATDVLLGRIDDYQEAMGADVIEANFEVWPIQEIDFYGYMSRVSSYEEEDTNVRAWLEQRLDWMDDNVDRWSQGP